MKMKKRGYMFLAAFVFVVCMIPFHAKLRRVGVAVIQIIKGRATVAKRMEQYGEAVRARLEADFKRLGVDYPPGRIIFVGLKQERLLEVWVARYTGNYQLLKTYPILGLSGITGPKLCEGDMQVPEGIYRIESLNPNSLYHLSLRIDYPNHFDKSQAEVDKRENLGGDIMIHGNSCSVGCLAMGDRAAEELFVLAAETGISNISVILSPVDFRINKLLENRDVPKWVVGLYDEIRRELAKLKN